MDRRTIAGLQVLLTLSTAGFACTGSFLAVFYRERGFSTTHMGLLFSGAALIGLVAQPFWGFLADKGWGKKRLLVLLLPVAALLAVFVPMQDGFGMTALFIWGISLFQSGIQPLSEALTLDVAQASLETPATGRKPVSYAFLRSFATAGFAVANLLIGILVERSGASVIFAGYALLLVLSLPAVLLMRVREHAGMRTHAADNPLLPILGRPAVLLLLGGVFLVTMAYIGGANYMNELVTAIGGLPSQLGLLWFVTCVVEYAVFFPVNRLIARFGILRVHRVGIALYAVKFILCALAWNMGSLYVAQALEGMAFTLFMVTAIERLNRITPPQHRASMLGIYGAVCGFGSLAAGLFGGLLLRVVSASGLFAVFAGLCAVALLLALAGCREPAHGQA